MKYSIVVIAFIIGISSCNKNDCKEELKPLKHFESESGCENTKHTLAIALHNNCTIIRSKNSYDSQVTGTCHPDIDFSIYDLVIGKQSSGNRNDTIMYDLRKTCPKGELTLTVDIIQSAITLPDSVVYHALIPKLGDEETLNVNINVR
jgi:hypothetical protein